MKETKNIRKNLLLTETDVKMIEELQKYYNEELNLKISFTQLLELLIKKEKKRIDNNK